MKFYTTDFNDHKYLYCLNGKEFVNILLRVTHDTQYITHIFGKVTTMRSTFKEVTKNVTMTKVTDPFLVLQDERCVSPETAPYIREYIKYCLQEHD